MLRITSHETETEVRLQLEGKLAGLWVAELERVWKAASTGKAMVIDLTAVDFVDAPGRALLRHIIHTGATAVAVTPFMREVLSEVTSC